MTWINWKILLNFIFKPTLTPSLFFLSLIWPEMITVTSTEDSGIQQEPQETVHDTDSNGESTTKTNVIVVKQMWNWRVDLPSRKKTKKQKPRTKSLFFSHIFSSFTMMILSNFSYDVFFGRKGEFTMFCVHLVIELWNKHEKRLAISLQPVPFFSMLTQSNKCAMNLVVEWSVCVKSHQHPLSSLPPPLLPQFFCVAKEYDENAGSK